LYNSPDTTIPTYIQSYRTTRIVNHNRVNMILMCSFSPQKAYVKGSLWLFTVKAIGYTFS